VASVIGSNIRACAPPAEGGSYLGTLFLTACQTNMLNRQERGILPASLGSARGSCRKSFNYIHRTEAVPGLME
jgi:hypothetical protein